MDPVTSAAVKDDDDPEKPRKKAHPWRDNVEAITVSIVVIVLFKYFVLEAYKIPTGSMQPTLMGWSPSPQVTARTGIEGGIHDRVLVDKLSFHFRDPLRWEVVVFRYPLDRSKNYIKRIVGMPGEDLEIRHGDLFAAPRGGEKQVLRRPRPVLDSMLLRLDTEDEWRVEGGGWTAGGDTLGGEAPGALRFPRTTSGVRDDYEDGYPASLRESMRIEGTLKRPGSNGVGDLRLEARVTARSDTTAVRVTLTEGRASYLFQLPGPAADPDAVPGVEVTGEEGGGARGEDPWRLAAGRGTPIAVENVDDLLRLEVDGRVVATCEVPAVARPESSGVRLSSEGSGARFEGVRILRDVYYVREGYERASWETPDDGYVMLGDNTLNSSDSREWTLARFSVPTGEGDEVQVLRGNHRDSEPLNDRRSRLGDNPFYLERTRFEPRLAFFHDERGERWAFRTPPARQLDMEAAPFVRRRHVLGRAVMVVWPLSPRRGIYRVDWIR